MGVATYLRLEGDSSARGRGIFGPRASCLVICPNKDESLGIRFALVARAIQQTRLISSCQPPRKAPPAPF